MSSEHDDLTVTYGVKELLSGIKTDMAAGFGRLETSLKAKADKSDMGRLEGRLDAHQNRIEALEKRQDKDEARDEGTSRNKEERRFFHERLWAALASLSGVALAVETYLIIKGH